MSDPEPPIFSDRRQVAPDYIHGFADGTVLVDSGAIIRTVNESKATIRRLWDKANKEGNEDPPVAPGSLSDRNWRWGTMVNGPTIFTYYVPTEGNASVVDFEALAAIHQQAAAELQSTDSEEE